MLKPVKKLILPTLAIVITLVVSPMAQAFTLSPAHSGEPTLLARASGMSLDQAVNQVRKETGGRVLSAKTVSRNGRRFHRIKVLMPSGRVKIVRKPAG